MLNLVVFETEEEQFTVVGYLPFICKGDSLKIIGKFIEHKDYGEQFKIETFEKLMPQTLSALEKYLANGNIKGVGPATASKIIKLFGDETIHVLKYEPSKLVQIKGITKDKAKEISESFIENWEVWQIVGFLERFGLGAESAKKVYDLLGINAISEIENDPYILIDITRGVEFSQIDKMAIELGIERENQKRVKSGIKYALIKITYNGHCCTLKENLIEYVKQILGVSEEIIEEGLINLKANEDIVIEKRDEEEWVYLYSFYKTENEIAERIIKLKNTKNVKKVSNIEKELKRVCAKHGLEYQKNVRVPKLDRAVSFVLESPAKPKLILDVSYSVTTSSSQGSKKEAARKTEAVIKAERDAGNNIIFVNFLDGAGWIGRQADLREIHRCSDYVLNFQNMGLLEDIIDAHIDEL